MPLTRVLLFSMFSKILLGCFLLVAVINAIPVLEDDEEDLPVYTEKVVPSRPTPPSKVASSSTIAKAHRFSPKKLHTLPKAAPLRKNRHLRPVESNHPAPEALATPKNLRKAPKISRDIKPIYLSSRPVKSVLRADYEAPQVLYASDEPGYDSPHHAPAAVQPSYAAPQPVHAPAQPAYSAAPRGDYSDPYEKPQPYSFGFEVKDEYGASQSRKEEGDDYGNKRGSYGYTDGYGIYRQVDYVADQHGFRARVKTNEPGTDNQDPADVEMHSEAQPVQHVSKY